LPFMNRLFYAAGGAGFNLLERVLTTWLMFYYVPPGDAVRSPLVAAGVFGSIFFFGRVVDALADPVISNWSDNSRAARGRRWPFLFWGGLPLTAVTIAIFYPPVAEESTLNVLYLALMLGLFFFFFTFYVCPYLALLPEIARNRNERVDLSTMQAIFIILGTALAMVASGPLIERFGFGAMVWIMGGIALIFLYMPVFAVDERRFSRARPAGLNLVEALKKTFQNRAFLVYLVGNALYWFGFNIITMGVPYYVTVLIGAREGQSSIFLGAAFGVALLCFPLINIAAKKWGKKAIMMFSMGAFVVLLPLIYFFNDPFLPLSPYAFGLLVLALLGIPLASLFIIPNALVADITDVDEMVTGRRRESMYFGAQGIVLKSVLALSSLTMGLLFQFFGSSTAEPLGIQLTGPVAAGFILIGLLIFRTYPEKEEVVKGEIDPRDLTI